MENLADGLYIYSERFLARGGGKQWLSLPSVGMKVYEV